MKKLLGLILVVMFGFSQITKADEGMWVLPLISKLNINDMQQKGFKLSAEDIYNINQSSLKDAIVVFGGGCTGEMISSQGLLLTNHHCGYGAIQALSSVEHNYLEDGFWAKSKSDELPAPGLSVTFLKRMEDVTDQVLAEVNANMSENDRQKKILEVSNAIAKKATEGTHYRARVQPFLNGNQYFLMVNEVFTDVRLAGTPPSSIGKFGHDTDNWMWPRHTGDFSIFRVYCGPDGKPAEYSANNVPFKPAHHLPISLKGTQMDEFAMTIGYPGRTERYLTSWGIEERMDITNEARITVRGVKQEIWLADMQADEKINIQYASKYAGSSNYWKNSIGMNKGLKNLNVLDKKRALENEFTQWVKSNPELTAKYGTVLPELQKAYSERGPQMKASTYLAECLLGGTEIFAFASRAGELKEALQKNNPEDIKKASDKLNTAAKNFYKNYSAATDQKVMASLMNLYVKSIGAEYHPEFYAAVNKKFKNDYARYAADLFKRSIFVSEDRLNAFLAAPTLKKLESDPAFIGGESVFAMYRKINGTMENSAVATARNSRLFLAGLMEMQPDKKFYSDANFTLRLSYGTVGDYEPKDGVIYKHFTTLKGVMEKEDPNNWEFVVPAKLKELYNNQDYGQYVDADGTMHLAFTTNNDITGGNSGSPVINGNGELFGLAFDGNWEAMSGDIAFEPELQKCINVDIRYVLFIVDKYAGATNLIDEMTLVK
jgi:hypothetical protein